MTNEDAPFDEVRMFCEVFERAQQVFSYVVRLKCSAVVWIQIRVDKTLNYQCKRHHAVKRVRGTLSCGIIFTGSCGYLSVYSEV